MPAPPPPTSHVPTAAADSPTAVFAAFFRLGCTSFGGPIAHLGYFRTEFVERRRWLDEAAYADIVALCQFLPGPASSQVGASLGLLRAGLPGGLAAWAGFTLPSAVAMVLFAEGLAHLADPGHAAWLHGLRIVAVAVVAQAVRGMAATLCPDRTRLTLAVACAILALSVPTALGQICAILLGAAAGWRLVAPITPPAAAQPAVAVPRALSLCCLAAFPLLLLGLPALAALVPSHPLDLASRFYRAGALVFGGGHVVLPLLRDAVVPPGWIGDDRFLAGYGAVQAVPGPLFTFAAYLGAAMRPGPSGWPSAALCLAAIYLPSFLLLVGVLPFWEGLRRRPAVRAALAGVNAAVVGILSAALYTPVWTTAIGTPADFALALAAFLLLATWRMPPWLVVGLGAAVAAAL